MYHSATEKLDAGQFTINPSQYEADLWENGRLECFVKLTRWDILAKNILTEIDDDLSQLWTSQYKDPYLKFFVDSAINLKELWPQLHDFIDGDNDHKVRISFTTIKEI